MMCMAPTWLISRMKTVFGFTPKLVGDFKYMAASLLVFAV